MSVLHRPNILVLRIGSSQLPKVLMAVLSTQSVVTSRNLIPRFIRIIVIFMVSGS